MKFIDLKSKIFKKFARVRTFFVIGEPLGRLLQDLKKRRFDLRTLKQAHGNVSFYVSERIKRPYVGDALYTDKSGIFLVVRSADCLPVLFYSDKAGIIGVVHAGWRGTYKKILQKTVQKVSKKFAISPKDFYFFFGPAAQVCCYNVSAERLKFFDKKILPKIVEKRDGTIFLNFVKANKLQLKALGVIEKQIENCGICTIHNLGYPSHRREGEKRPTTLLALMGLKQSKKTALAEKIILIR